MTLRSNFVSLLVLSVLCGVIFRAPLSALVKLTLQNEDYNYILLIPLVSLGLLFLERKRIFASLGYCPKIGLPLMLSGMLVYLAGKLLTESPVSLSLAVLAVVLIWQGGFVLCCGSAPFRRAAFPLLFLLCISPPPAFVLDKAIEFLRAGSGKS